MLVLTCWIDPDEVFYHSTKWLSGLLILQKKGLLKLRLRIPSRKDSLICKDAIIPFRVEQNGDRAVGVLDLLDSSREFSLGSFNQCLVYFKRSYYAPDVAILGQFAEQVRPAGLNHSCRVPGLARSILTTVAPAQFTNPLRAARYHLRFLLGAPPSSHFEQSPLDPVERKIIYQTRVWEDQETTDESADKINDFRVSLTMALREAFGPQFAGGLVPTPLARKRYPQALATEAWRKSAYIGKSKKHLIGIYSHGLHKSTGKKLPEYLAASQCIVAQTPRNPVSPNFLEGRNFLGFTDIEGCVESCRKLLDDPERSQAMRRENHSLYNSEVEPAAWVSRIIAELVKESNKQCLQLEPFAPT